MQPQIASRYQFTPVSSGPDWITATCSEAGKRLEFERLGDQWLDIERDRRRDVSAASRFGYQGHATKGLFVGRRDRDSILVASGPDTPARAIPIIEAATNVSRLDLQVTVWTHGEQPHLAMESYHRLTRNRHLAHRPGQVTLITSDPKGETLNVNKRSSDAYGRLYDKASEAEAGPPRTLWRYEVEFKRSYARAYASALSRCTSIPDFTKREVHQWWARKQVVPAYPLIECPSQPEARLELPEHDVLAWFERSVSITVARAIKRHGLRVTLAALALDALVEPIMKGGSTDGR